MMMDSEDNDGFTDRSVVEQVFLKSQITVKGGKD